MSNRCNSRRSHSRAPPFELRYLHSYKRHARSRSPAYRAHMRLRAQFHQSAGTSLPHARLLPALGTFCRRCHSRPLRSAPVSLPGLTITKHGPNRELPPTLRGHPIRSFRSRRRRDEAHRRGARANDVLTVHIQRALRGYSCDIRASDYAYGTFRGQIHEDSFGSVVGREILYAKKQQMAACGRSGDRILSARCVSAENLQFFIFKRVC